MALLNGWSGTKVPEGRNIGFGNTANILSVISQPMAVQEDRMAEFLAPLRETEILQPPRPSAIINSLRAIGYSFNTAVADIIDNSIAAGAKRVDVSFDIDPPWVAIIDDGKGMSRDELISAMQHGGAGPNDVRSAADLGRYGLGLKTASLSQCRRLTVVSVKHGIVSAARWDLNEIERRDKWILLLPQGEQVCKLPGYTDLVQNEHGTLVLWEDFDRATAGEPDKGHSLQRLVLNSGQHLGLVFHRFLAPEVGQRQLVIAVNRRSIEAADPFLRSNLYTELAGEETQFIDGHKIGLKAYILPHISRITEQELERAGGKEHLRDTQGFYVYRNRRLITWGTWFRLLGRDELTRLARIQIDIPNALDHLWGLDVKKATAHPPEEVRRILRQIITVVAQKSINVFRERRRKQMNDPITYFWDRSRVRDAIRYDINRDHPLLKSLQESSTPQQCSLLGRVLNALELSLPVRSIYHDQASNEAIDQSDQNTEASLRELLGDLLKTCATEAEQKRLIDGLRLIEPFSNYPNVTAGLTGEISHA
jgi:hypothetical protein